MNAGLAGFPHPDGHYTGEMEDGLYYVAGRDGFDYLTPDAPEEKHVLHGVAHAEYYVKSGMTVIYGVSPIPAYLHRGETK